ncbi:hypothetical protein F2P81_023734 [Scophthalmus maximus]|uniref:Uncharacterized protein n=1 Tax=Scophthalmus maximus TaxID=52904 RepID=A0A6A4RXB6_SCOMX|nr:hypothetical protein F2P81_023734 [Scophthalmus maximus]
MPLGTTQRALQRQGTLIKQSPEATIIILASMIFSNRIIGITRGIASAPSPDRGVPTDVRSFSVNEQCTSGCCRSVIVSFFFGRGNILTAPARTDERRSKARYKLRAASAAASESDYSYMRRTDENEHMPSAAELTCIKNRVEIHRDQCVSALDTTTAPYTTRPLSSAYSRARIRDSTRLP